MSNFKNPLRSIKTDFRTGETDPLYDMRLDSKAYPSASRSLTNMLLQTTGGTSRRPGMITVATLPQRSRLLEFEFDINEKYVLAFSDARLDVYDANGTLLQTLGAQPWNALTIFELTSFQKGDVMFIAHPTFQPRRLLRTGLSSFLIDLVNFSTDTGENVVNQPQIKFAPGPYALAISDINPGAGRTLSANAGIFSPSWVGERIRIYGKEMAVTGYISPTQLTVFVTQRIVTDLDVAPFRYVEGSTTVEVTHVVHGLTSGASVLIEGATDTFGITPAEINGSRVITVTDQDHYTVVAAGTGASASGDGGGPSVTIGTGSATTTWTEQVWSNRRGWPGAVTLHENRVWFAGSYGAPTFLAGSAVGDFFDFNVREGLADESVQATISATSRIQYLVSAKQLQIFTENSEAATDTEQGQPITPANFNVKNYTAYGAHIFGRPRVFDGATLFIQNRGKNIREFVYDYRFDGYGASAVSILASHMINSPHDMAVFTGTATRPEQYAFFINGIGGTVACFHSIRAEELAAWTPFVNGRGNFDSVCVMGHSVFFSVNRDGRFDLDRFELDATDVWLDGAVRLAGAASTVWTLGPRYAGRTVTVMSGLTVLGTFVANGAGAVTLPSAVTSIVAGYDYPVLVVPLPPDKELNDGPMTGEIRRIVSANIHFRGSSSCTVNGQDILLPLGTTNGKVKVRLLGYDEDPFITIMQPVPGPLTILGMNLEVSI